MRFQPDFSKAHAGFPIVDRGEYEVEITGVQGYFNIKDDGSPSAGVRCLLKLIGEVGANGKVKKHDASGENISPHMLWVHTPKAYGMAKQFILAAMGYSIRDEKKANSDFFDGADFDFEVDDSNPDDVSIALGSAWENLVGKSVRVTADVRQWEGRDQQDYRTPMPVK